MTFAESARHSVLLLSFALAAGTAYADVTDPTPYNYEHVPKPGREAGTFAFTGSGAAGPDCLYVIVGGAKFLPDGSGTGGTFCGKGNIELSGSGPACATAPVSETMLAVVGGTYTLNGDGTVCENLKFIGGVLDGMALHLPHVHRARRQVAGRELSGPALLRRRAGQRPEHVRREWHQDQPPRGRSAGLWAASLHEPIGAQRFSRKGPVHHDIAESARHAVWTLPS